MRLNYVQSSQFEFNNFALLYSTIKNLFFRGDLFIRRKWLMSRKIYHGESWFFWGTGIYLRSQI